MVGNQADIINAASPIKDIHDTRNDKAWVDWMDTNKVGISDAARAFGLSDAEVKERYDAVKKPAVKPVTAKNPVTGEVTPAGPRTTIELPTTPRTNAPPGVSNPVGGPNTPGDRTINPDGSVTITPNIPGRPYGGFSGMDEVKNAYTKGGGSLGYTPYVPKTAAEHAKMYNTQTGDSLAAYNYLMGKGAYPTKSGVSEIMKPYEEAVLGYPTDITKKKYINVGGKMVLNPDYKAPQTQAQKAAAATAAAKSGKVPSIEVTDSSGETSQTFTAVLQDDGSYLAGNGKRYDSSGKELAAYGGVMGYAEGGISGDGNLNLHIPLDFGGGGGGGFGGFGGGLQELMSSTATTGAFGGQNNTAGGGFGVKPDETGGLADQAQVSYAPGSEAGIRAVEQGRARGTVAGTLYNGPSYMANGGMAGYAVGGGLGSLGGYSDGGRLLKGPGDGVSDSIPATIGRKQQPARLADGEFVVPARIVSELGNGSTDAGARKLYAMMDRVQKARGKTTGKKRVATNTRADKYLPA
jgi:hypothetical protein